MLHSTLCVFVFVAFSVSSSLPTSQMECHKSLFYFVVGIFSFVSLSLSTANPCDSIQMFLPLLCLYCWMSAAAGLFQVSHIQLGRPFSLILHLLHCIVSHQAGLNNIVPSVPYSTLHCKPPSLKPGSISDMA